jgi:N utilization substance protein B
MNAARSSPARRAREPKSAARFAAVQALYQMEMAGSSAEAALQDVIAGRLPAMEGGPAEGKVDQALFRTLVEGAVAAQSAIDTEIARALAEGWRLERIDAVARAVLRAGVAELMGQRQTPVAVIIDEYVAIADAFFEGPEPGFINAALQACARTVRQEGT